MEIEIFVSETGKWIVAEWPKETEENAHILEQLHLEEGNDYDAIDTNVFSVGRHRVKVIFHVVDGSYECPQEQDFYTTFELLENTQ
jgi:hypothetical protein